MNFSKTRQLLLVIACLIAAPILSLQAAEARTTLHRGNASEPDTLDPQKANIVPDQVIIGDMVLPLVAGDANGLEIPGGASHWDISDDGLVYTFYLRDGLEWSDGTPITADDYVAGIQRLYTPATASQAAAFVYMIENAQAVHQGDKLPEELGVRALDRATVEIRLWRPEPQFLNTISSVWFAPIPRAVVAQYGDAWTKPEHYVGSGPFLLKEWSPNDRIVLAKNPNFIEADQIKLDEVIYYPSENSESALKRFRAGELDFVSGVPSHKIDFLKDQLAAETRLSAYPAINYIVFNTSIAPFDDKRVRTALAIAIDRQTYADKIMKKGEQPAVSFVPAAIRDYPTPVMDYADLPLAERRELARALLDDAGFNDLNPLSFDFRVRASPDRKRGAVAISAMWKAIGVDGKIHSTELKTHYADIDSGNYVVAGAGFVGSSGPEIFLELFLSDNTIGNSSRYKNPAYDALMAKAFPIPQIGPRYAKMAEAEALMLKDFPVAPINYSVTGNLVSTHVRGYEDNIYDAHPSRFMWIEE
ncbi:MAG: peptide ABC transporter substrate-binding protein [Alphaproteobacteria bacterium]|nr:MAG: peptide ABC transporter substrate-binding protein [Alphaproteobacteria bacterium]